MVVKGDGNLDYVYYEDKTWYTISDLFTGSYHTVIADGGLADRFYGAADDGLYYLYWDSGIGWRDYQLSTDSYTALANIPGTADAVFAARADGGVEKIYYDSGWQSELLLDAGVFQSLAVMPR